MQGERDFAQRTMRLQEKENSQAKLDGERKAIYQERVEVEKIKNNSEVELKRTLSLQAEAESRINQAAQKEANADKELTEAKQLNSSAELQLNQAIEKEKKVKIDLENIQKVRDGITPKIAEIEALIKKNEKILAENKQKEDNINAKAVENEKMLEIIKKKDSALESKKTEIAEREEAITRQEIIVKNLKGKNG